MGNIPSDNSTEITRRIIGRPVDLRDPYLAAYLYNELGGPIERLCVLYARTNGQWCHVTAYSQGQSAGVATRIRSLVEIGIHQNAERFLIAHGHPSGIAYPSSQDIEATRKLLSVSSAIDLELIDHLIVGENSIFSMRTGRTL